MGGTFCENPLNEVWSFCISATQQDETPAPGGVLAMVVSCTKGCAVVSCTKGCAVVSCTNPPGFAAGGACWRNALAMPARGAAAALFAASSLARNAAIGALSF